MSHGRFAISLHILTILAKISEIQSSDQEWVSSEYIAESININPVLVRKEISNLRKANLVRSKEGKKGGSALVRSADQIFLSEVYKSIYEKPSLSFYKNNPNLNCPIGKQIQENIEELFQSADNAVLAKLGCTTLQQFCDKFD